MKSAISVPDDVFDREARTALIEAFLASGFVAELDEADIIASHALDYTCDYLGDDAFRWSPIVVEQFMLDYLPRKVSLNLGQVRQTPVVLRGWVRFALTNRGLEERWIAETERAVGRFAKEFRRAMTDSSEFGPAKALGTAMLADGVDFLEQTAVDRWINEFNARPLAERDQLLGKLVVE